ncbi:MAG: response regulator [Blautia hansenii]
MYQVLLVDDEPLILTGIQSMINWEDYDCVITDKASNGKQALEKMEKSMPDIVITDIKMPVMTGIEFMQECRDRGYDTVFILLTNLEEFSLAKSALALGAADYLVKMEMTQEMMGNSLKRATEMCNQKRILTDKIPHREFHPKDVKQTATGFFRDILEKAGNLSDEFRKKWQEPVEKMELEQLYENGVLMWIRPYKDRDLFENVSEDDRKEMLDYAQSLMEQFMNRIHSGCCTLVWKRMGILAILPGQNRTEKYYRDTGKKICNILEDYFGCQTLVAISAPMEDIWGGSKRALSQIKKIQEFYYYHSNEPVVLVSDVEAHFWEERHARHDTFDISFLKKDLRQALVQQDKEKVNSVFEELSALFTEFHPAREQVVNACANLYYFFLSYVEEDALIKEEMPYPSVVMEILLECFTLKAHTRWLLKFGSWVGNTMENFHRGSKTDKIVEAAKEYVRENYGEKLTLAAIASKIGISQGYLSSVFKKQTGGNLNDYINQIKIEKAKELLEKHEYMMYEISDMLGFENPYYFSKVFKKLTGITPSEYEMHKAAQN